MVIRKGLHIIRAIFPELSVKTRCRWCGDETRQAVPYRPALKETEHGKYELCFTCSLRCSALEGQPPVSFMFVHPNWRMKISA